MDTLGNFEQYPTQGTWTYGGQDPIRMGYLINPEHRNQFQPWQLTPDGYIINRSYASAAASPESDFWKLNPIAPYIAGQSWLENMAKTKGNQAATDFFNNNGGWTGIQKITNAAKLASDNVRNTQGNQAYLNLFGYRPSNIMPTGQISNLNDNNWSTYLDNFYGQQKGGDGTPMQWNPNAPKYPNMGQPINEIMNPSPVSPISNGGSYGGGYGVKGGDGTPMQWNPNAPKYPNMGRPINEQMGTSTPSPISNGGSYGYSPFSNGMGLMSMFGNMRFRQPYQGYQPQPFNYQQTYGFQPQGYGYQSPQYGAKSPRRMGYSPFGW